jgi:hypothetical protein
VPSRSASLQEQRYALFLTASSYYILKSPRRSQEKVISGDFGRFDSFVETLHSDSTATTAVIKANEARQNPFKFLDHYRVKRIMPSFRGNFRGGKPVKPTASTRLMERAMGIELYPQFISLALSRRCRPRSESIGARWS